MKTYIIRKSWLLLIGIAFTGLSHLTCNVELLAWISCVPYLIFLNVNKGAKSIIFFALAYMTGWNLAVLKIIVPPIPWIMVPLYAVPITLIHLPAFLAWSKFRNSPYKGMLFPALLTVLEWVQFTFTPLGSWGAMAYTQIDSIIPLQTASLFGISGLGFLIYWVNSLLAEVIIHRKINKIRLGTAGIVIISLHAYGSIRHDLFNAQNNDQIMVAAVGTDSKISGIPLPEQHIIERDQEKLLDRTREAARAGARIISWNEAATVIGKAEEELWKAKLSQFTAEHNIHLIASYIVLLSEKPFRFENKYVLIQPNGEILYEYNKHRPVPGEPANKGSEVIKSFPVDGVNIGAAICYDYDFPGIARRFGRSDADIVFLPSSDWRGIDPIHTKMAALRAIEQGHSILRSTRFGLSAAINPVGDLVAQQSSFDTNNKIMISHLPVRRSTTLYGLTGDAFVYLCILSLMAMSLLHFRTYNETYSS